MLTEMTAHAALCTLISQRFASTTAVFVGAVISAR